MFVSSFIFSPFRMYAVSSHIQQNNIYSMCSRVFANALRLDVLIFVVVVVAISGVPLQYVLFLHIFCSPIYVALVEPTDFCVRNRCKRKKNRHFKSRAYLSVYFRMMRLYSFLSLSFT